VFKPQISGDYAVELQETNCTFISTCYPFIFVGVEALTSTIDVLKVSPNPVDNIVMIRHESTKTNRTLFIKNVLGQVVYTEKMLGKGKAVDVSDLPSGVYLVVVHAEGEQWVEELVIQH